MDNNEVKKAKVINAEENTTKATTIYLKDNGARDYITVRDLLNSLNRDLEVAREKGIEEDFLSLPLRVGLSDIEGQVVEGLILCDIGWFDDEFVLSGNVESLSFVLENN